MPVETNLNVSPYFDDFDKDDKFHRILFKPAVPVQARELTQLQTILQDQVEIFGDNIFHEGTIIEGCSFSFDNSYEYVKLNDLREDGQPLNVLQHSGQFARNQYGLIAEIVDVKDGLETQDPDLNTFYLKYTNTGTDDSDVYVTTEVITIYPTFNDAINETNTVAQVRVADVNDYADPVGFGFAFTVSDGIIFQKGHFIRVDEQSIVVSKYTDLPNDLAVGFTTDESLINSDQDSSLLDNASGFTNENAPGADRLKLSAVLAVKTFTELDTEPNFFSLAEFEQGRISRQRQTTQYSVIGSEMARRTSEESGDYVITPFDVVSEPSANTETFNLVTSSGLAYIDGFRVEHTNPVYTEIRNGNDVVGVENQAMSVTYGNYFFVNEMAGSFLFQEAVSVSLRDTAYNKLSTDVTNATITAPGAEIGTARAIAVQYHSGVAGDPDCQYKLYLTDITMNPGKSISRVKSVYYNGTNDGIADVVLESGKAVLKETGFKTLIYPLPNPSVKTIRSISGGTNNTEFTYRLSDESIQFNIAGQAVINITDYFPYGLGQLSEALEAEVDVICRQTTNIVKTGTADSSGTTTVAGTGTDFIGEFEVGDYITIDGQGTARIEKITSSTSLVTDSAISTGSGAVRKTYLSGVPIPIVGRPADITISNSSQTMTIDLQDTLPSTMNATVYYNVTKRVAVQKTKDAHKDVYVKIDTDTHPNGTTGPWTLGLPDVYKVKAIYEGATYDELNPNTADKFNVATGQTDTMYGLSSLKLQDGKALTGTKLLIKLDVFKHETTGGGTGFFTIDSYPTPALGVPAASDEIEVINIPIYRTSEGDIADLRGCVDFRFAVDATGSYATTIGTASENPSATETVTNAVQYLPAPNSDFSASLQYYQGRVDIAYINSYGDINIIEGIPSENPTPPPLPDAGMIICYVYVPPFPTLPTLEATYTTGRRDHTIKIKQGQQKRFTMSDIGELDERLNRLEYYTSLSLLETAASEMVIPDGSGVNRFKHGIFVDSFDNTTIGELENPGFSVGYLNEESAITAMFKPFDIKMQYSTGTNTVKDNTIVSLSSDSVAVITQPNATGERAPVPKKTSNWKWRSKGKTTPPYNKSTEKKIDPVPLTSNPTVIKRCTGKKSQVDGATIVTATTADLPEEQQVTRYSGGTVNTGGGNDSGGGGGAAPTTTQSGGGGRYADIEMMLMQRH